MGRAVGAGGVVGPSKVLGDCNIAAGVRLEKVGCVRCDFEDHVAGKETDDDAGVCVEIVH